MYLITAVFKPHMLEEVKEALTAVGIGGMTVTEVQGFGRQRGHTANHRDAEDQADFVPKMKIEVVADVMVADDVVKAIGEAARTGSIGDGKVWVTEINQVMRIRTAEMGLDALT